MADKSRDDTYPHGTPSVCDHNVPILERCELCEQATTKPRSTTEQTLEPCPFCGSAAHLRNEARGGRKKPPEYDYFVSCARSYTKDCPLHPRAMNKRNTEIEAITAWNTRLSPASTAPVVDKHSEPDIYDLVAQYRDRVMVDPVCVHCELPIALEQSGWIHVGSGLVTCRRTGLAKHDGVFRAAPAAATAAPVEVPSCAECGAIAIPNAAPVAGWIIQHRDDCEWAKAFPSAREQWIADGRAGEPE